MTIPTVHVPCRAALRTRLGIVVLQAEGNQLTSVRFADEDEIPNLTETAANSHDAIAFGLRWLALYFDGHNPDFMPPFALRGTAFQQAVWHEVERIPYGSTATYGDIARQVGCRSAQAVGQAVGRNPMVLLVPCHRVTGSGGMLAGYAYGTDRKQQLLLMEQASMATLR